MSHDQPTVSYTRLEVPRRRRRPPFGRLIWPWSFVTTNTAVRAPLVVLNRYPGQIIGIHFRLPDGSPAAGGVKHYGLSIRWGKPT